jgi:polysaccharide pyruvyl transferase WcaK-like protein
MTSKIGRIILYSKQQFALWQSLPLIAEGLEELLSPGKKAIEKKVGRLTLKLADLDSLSNIDLAQEASDCLYVLPITRDNLYLIQDDLIATINIVPVLTFAPSDFHARLHAHNLFHQSISLRRSVFAHNYYTAVIKQLTDGFADCETIKITNHLGKASTGAMLKDIASRIGTKLGWWLFTSRLRAMTTALRTRPSKKPNSAKKVLITGWYGTETAGDKAILMELIDVLEERYGNVDLHITSIAPSYSLLTNEELGITLRVHDLKALPYGDLADTDLVVFGGGPVMDSSQLKYIGVLFKWAKKRSVQTLLFGCGVGPLKKPDNRIVAQEILAASSGGFFRDQASMIAAMDMGYTGPELCASDPALRYVYRWSQDHTSTKSLPAGLVTMLRAQTREYSSNAGAAQQALSEIMTAFLSKKPSQPITFLAMHSFWLGNDDRTYNRNFAHKEVFPSPNYSLEKPQTLQEILTAIAAASYGIPMRFHGHIFLLAMAKPFIGIDYTGKGGKVSSLIARYQLNDFEMTIDDSLSASTLSERWEKLKDNQDNVTGRIKLQRDADIRALEDTYDQVFEALEKGKAR